MRQFIRHPATIPIEVAGDDPLAQGTRQLRNVSLGGLAFESDVRFEPEALVKVRIPFVNPAFETRARVVWCSARAGRYELGVQFLDPQDAFVGRMVEQVCHIENYRKVVRETEGRALTVEDAAAEWINKYAAQFPDPGPDGAH
jgi:PilZ domain